VRPQDIITDVDWLIVPSDATTTFENVYTAAGRRQRVPALARQITLDDIPESWRTAPLIALCPVFHDCHPALGAALQRDGSLVALGAQGWLRQLVDDQVVVSPVDPDPVWLSGDAVFVSEEDVSDPENVAAWRGKVPIVVLTRASRGASVWEEGCRVDVRAVEAPEVDPTGAGDVFMVAFMVRYCETGSAAKAARFAAAAAALAVGRPGFEGIGTRDEIESLLSQRLAVRS
jgi:sugar/nucleoside kinase (ribokinase family)